MKKQNVTFTFILLLFTSWNFGQNWNEILNNSSSDIEESDYFGSSVSVSGNYAIVGAWGEDENVIGIDSLSLAGSVYIFERDSSKVWIEKQKLVPSDRFANDRFGYAVSISGNFAVATANQASKAYVFERNSLGIWNEVQKIVAIPDGQPVGSDFGRSVSISGNYIIVGAREEREDASGLNTISAAGAAYVYERDVTGTWVGVQKIVPSDRGIGYQFGWSCSLSGDYAVVGAFWDSKDASGGNIKTAAGAAYVFKRDVFGTWQETDKLVASDRDSADYFGNSVGISGDYIIIGARSEDEGISGGNSMSESGSAYLFEKNASGNWVQIQKLVATDRGIRDYFGQSVSISGEYVIIGAYGQDYDEFGSNVIGDAGGAYIYHRDLSGYWSLTQKITASNRGNADNFGFSVNISDSNIFIGAVVDDFSPISGIPIYNSGSIYVFSLSNYLKIQENKSQNKLVIYPNPTESILNIRTDFRYTKCRVIDILGNTIFERNLTDQLHVSSLVRGAYFIQIIGDNNEVLKTEKFNKY